MRASLPLLSAGTVFLIGGALTLQAALNARLGERVGHPLTAAAISFAVGLVGLLLAAAFARVPMPTGTMLASAPWPLWIGGLFGAIFIAASVVLVPRVGPGIFFTIVIAGQLGAALVLEHFGWLGLPRTPVTPVRLAGMLAIVGGVLLVRWQR